jgi:signal transduction histidine kinase
MAILQKLSETSQISRVRDLPVTTHLDACTDFSRPTPEQKWAEGLQKIRTDSALQGKQHLEHFLDTTSHEMRNPLSAIMQCADSITSSYPQEDRQARQNITPDEWSSFIESTLDAAQTIGVCASHMKHIVDDILTISKLDSGLLDMTPVIAQPKSVRISTYRLLMKHTLTSYTNVDCHARGKNV